MDKLFLTLFNMSISASFLVVAVIIIRAFLKKSPKFLRCILWGLVAIRLIIPSFPQFSLSVMPSSEIIGAEALYESEPEIDTGNALINDSVNPLFSHAFRTDEISSANKLQIDVYILSLIWALGVICLLLYAFISYLRLKRIVSASVRTDRGTYICDSIRSPFILGVLRPKIYLPSLITEKEAELAEAHERAHLKRKDHLWKPIGYILISFYWMNPLIWLSYFLLCRDIELACDEKVLNAYNDDGKKKYAETLLSFEVKSRGITACPLAFGESGVKQRIKNVLNYKRPAFWVIAAGLFICAAVCVFFMTDPLKTDISIRPDDISSAKVYNALTVEDDGMTDLGSEEIAELSSMLCGIDKLKKSNEYNGLTPLYAVYVYGKNNDVTTVRGYDAAGSHTDLVYKGKTYVVRSDVFNKFVRDLCFGGADLTPSSYDIDTAVHNAVVCREGNDSRDGTLFESHRLLKTEDKKDKITVYAWILSEEYVDLSKDKVAFPGTVGSVLQKGLYTVSGSHYPAAISFLKTDKGYELSEYWTPRDGGYYVKDIRAKFPKDIAQEGLDPQKYILPQTQENYNNAVRTLNVDAGSVIDSLFDLVVNNSASAYSSNPKDYIDNGDLYIRELLYYGHYTFEYVVNEFYKGGSYGLKGHIMRYVLDRIIGGEAINISADTGQDYFKEWIKHNEKLLELNGDAFMKERYPYGYSALKMKN